MTTRNKYVLFFFFFLFSCNNTLLFKHPEMKELLPTVNDPDSEDDWYKKYGLEVRVF